MLSHDRPLRVDSWRHLERNSTATPRQHRLDPAIATGWVVTRQPAEVDRKTLPPPIRALAVASLTCLLTTAVGFVTMALVSAWRAVH